MWSPLSIDQMAPLTILYNYGHKYLISFKKFRKKIVTTSEKKGDYLDIAKLLNWPQTIGRVYLKQKQF